MSFLKDLHQWQNSLGWKKGDPLSRTEQEIIYSAAYTFYQEKRYQKAVGCFIQLIFHDPYDVRFWNGLAASHQMEKNYLSALHAWAALALLSKNSPVPHFHAAECYLSLENKEEAKKALVVAEGLVSKRDPLFEKIQILKETIYG